MAKAAKKKAAKKKPTKTKIATRPSTLGDKGIVVFDAKGEVFYFPPGTLVRRIENDELAKAAIDYASKVGAEEKVCGYSFMMRRGGPGGGMDGFMRLTKPTILNSKKR